MDIKGCTFFSGCYKFNLWNSILLYGANIALPQFEVLECGTEVSLKVARRALIPSLIVTSKKNCERCKPADSEAKPKQNLIESTKYQSGRQDDWLSFLY